jgi:hypothetical protein
MIKCPACGEQDEFTIAITDGAEADIFQGASGRFRVTEVRHGNVVWGDNSATQCRACQHTAPLKAFAEMGRGSVQSRQ